MPEVVTLGETMVLFNPVENSPLRYVHYFSKHVAGAESNVAIGLTRLGHSVGWISRLGNDEFGRYIYNFLRGEGVDVSQVKFDPAAPTGIFFKERLGLGETKVYYYRRDSAASRLKPEDLDREYIAGARYLHITGITPALSPSCYETVKAAIDMAKEAGVKVILDPNIRLKLWSKEEARKVILELCSKADIILPGLSEGEILLGKNTPEDIAKELLGLGAQIVVVKIGAGGAYYASPDEEGLEPGFRLPQVIDNVGAGDGFAAGFIAGILKGTTLKEAVRMANAVGAFATTVKGDIEALPTLEQLESFLGTRKQVDR